MKKRLLIDCSFISTTKLNTGIQRVVRQVVENIYTICENSEYEPCEIVLKNNIIKQISMDQNNIVIDENVLTTKDDVILLLDSTWHLDTWGSIQNAKQNGTKVIAVIYDIIPISHPEFCDKNLVKLFKKWFDQAIDYVDGFITISHTVQNQLEEYLNKDYPKKVAQKKFDFFHLGADFDYKKFDVHTTDVKKDLVSLYDKNKNIYLIVCTVEPRKNHKYLLDVFDKLWEQNVDVTLNIVGKKGWKVDELISRIQNHQEYKKRLFHWDNLNDVELNYCYQNSKMLLFPSYIEGFGLPIIESLNNKLPVMASDIPIHREVGCDHAEYFDLQNTDDLVEKVKSIETNGIPTKLIIEEGFKWMDWYQSTSMLFEKIVSMEKKIKVKKLKVKKLPKRSTKSFIKSIPVFGWFVRWSYNLLRLNNMKHILFLQQENMQSMQKKVSLQNNHIKVLENQLKNNQNILQAIGSKLSEQETKLSKQETKLSEQETKLSEQQKELNNLDDKLDKKIDQHILHHSNAFQERIDQFLFDAKIDLSNKKI